MNTRQLISMASATEARFNARQAERQKKWAGFRLGALSSVETHAPACPR